MEVLAQYKVFILILLAIAVVVQFFKIINYYREIDKLKNLNIVSKRFSYKLTRSDTEYLYERAYYAAIAWVDDIGEQNYLDIYSTRFVVSGKRVLVQLESTTAQVVNVTFVNVKGQWVRDCITYNSRRIR